MKLDDFWNIVNRVHAEAGFHIPTKCLLLAVELRKLSPDEIVSWTSHYEGQRRRAKTWDIHAINVLFCGCTSDDAFSDFYSDLVSCGKEIFEAVMNDPDCLGDLVGDKVDIGKEGYQYVASNVYTEITGTNMDHSLLPPFAEMRGEEWHSREDLERRFPRMWARFSHRLMID